MRLLINKSQPPVSISLPAIYSVAFCLTLTVFIEILDKRIAQTTHRYITDKCIALASYRMRPAYLQRRSLMAEISVVGRRNKNSLVQK